MKAILLAAGPGTRLRPITDKVPKCLVPISGKPLLGHWLDSLIEIGVDSILINLHHLSDQVREFIMSRRDRDQVTLVDERVLLGTAGTVRENHGFFSGDRGMVIHADNFCRADLAKFVRDHEIRPACTDLTMMTFVSKDPSSCGIVELDDEGIVQRFHEKVPRPPGNLANAAIYIFEPEVIEFISSSQPGEFVDISHDVIPRYLGRIFATAADGPVIDIGTLENLERARSKMHNIY